MPLSPEDLQTIDAHIAAHLQEAAIRSGEPSTLEIAIERLTLGQAQLTERHDRLEAAVERLVEGQAKLEAAVAMLVEGQAKLEAAVAMLVEGQAKLEATVAKLAEGQIQLFQGQSKLFEVQAKLIEGQAKLFEGQAKLFEGQANLEAAVAKLAQGLDALRQQVGALSENVGFGLEELAATFLPALLEKKDGLHVSELARAFVPSGAADAEEVDLLANARRNSEVLTVVVECKGRIYVREVQEFLRKIDRLAPHLDHPPYPVMVAYAVHPSAQRLSDRIRFVSSHML